MWRKDEKRSNREKKKPKQVKKVMPATSPLASIDQRGKPGRGGSKKSP